MATEDYFDHSLETFLAPKSQEERYVYVLERLHTNAKYRCRTCQHLFSGGNQKIRVHMTGVREGGSSVKPCPNPDPEAIAFCSLPRKSYKRKENGDEPAGPKLKLKKEANPSVDMNKLASVHAEAWSLLHNPSKHVTASADPLAAVAAAVADDPLALPSPARQPIDQLARLFDEYGVEKPEDLGLLGPEHLIRLAEVLKVVPRRVFLEMMGVTAGL
jgi:hypothetical protein